MFAVWQSHCRQVRTLWPCCPVWNLLRKGQKVSQMQVSGAGFTKVNQLMKLYEYIIGSLRLWLERTLVHCIHFAVYCIVRTASIYVFTCTSAYIIITLTTIKFNDGELHFLYTNMIVLLYTSQLLACTGQLEFHEHPRIQFSWHRSSSPRYQLYVTSGFHWVLQER